VLVELEKLLIMMVEMMVVPLHLDLHHQHLHLLIYLLLAPAAVELGLLLVLVHLVLGTMEDLAVAPMVNLVLLVEQDLNQRQQFMELLLVMEQMVQ
jgi:hypothetical protein